MRTRAAIVAALALGFLAAAAPGALAADGMSKPRSSPSKLAIKEVSDTTGEQTVTYRVVTYDGYDDVNDYDIMRWYFDTNGDGRYADMCIRLQSVGDGRLRAEFYPKCGGFVWATAEARKPAPNVVEFSLLIRDLINGGGVVPGSPIQYRVETEDFWGRTDWIPDRGFIQQTALPHLSAAELTGRMAGPGEKTAREANTSGPNEAHGLAGKVAGLFNGRFAAVGGLPIGWLVVVTLLIVAVIWLGWSRLTRRLFPADEHPAARASDPVHSQDT